MCSLGIINRYFQTELENMRLIGPQATQTLLYLSGNGFKAILIKSYILTTPVFK